MSLVIQKQTDFSTTLIRGLNNLKGNGTVDFDYYSAPNLFLGGGEVMLADQVLQLVASLKEGFGNKIEVLLISNIEQDRAEYYFYIKNEKFSEGFFEKLVNMKPLYTHFLKIEESWRQFGTEISTFDVSNSDDCCLLLSFNFKERTM